MVYADYEKSNKERLYFVVVFLCSTNSCYWPKWKTKTVAQSGEQIFEDLEPIANMWHNYELIVHEHYQ